MYQNQFDVALGRSPQPPPALDWIQQPARTRFRYAGFWRRFFASIIDGIILGILTKFLDALFSRIFDRVVNPPPGSWLAFCGSLAVFVFAYVVVDWIYHAGLESSARQATPGKRALGIVVTDLAGNRISFGRATARHFAQWVSFLTLLIGYLIQPFTKRRQALHDLIAGTLVVEEGGVPLITESTPAVAAREVPHRESGFPGWAKGLIAGSLVLCGGCVALGYFVALPLRDKFEESTTNQIAETIALQVGQVSPQAGRFRLNEMDLDINTYFAGSGNVGVNWSTNGTTISGFETGIDPSGIALGANGTVMYRAVPAIADGLVTFSEIKSEEHDAFTGLLLSARSFERGFEEGINRALAAQGLRPTRLTLGNGVLTIVVAPMDSAWAKRCQGACG